MKWFPRNKKGSTTVFLSMILTAVLMVVWLLVQASMTMTAKSYVDGTFDLAGRSILSEYNIKLMEDYGIFGVAGQDDEMTDKLTFYAENSFQKKGGQNHPGSSGGMDLLNLKMEKIQVDLRGYGLSNVDVLEEQILDHVAYKLGKDLLFDKEERTINENQGIELRNRKEIGNLPSAGYEGSNLQIGQIISAGLPSVQELKSISLNTFLVNEYILHTFQNHRGVFKERKTFFTNEVEYILCGELEDDENYQETRNYLLLLRTGLNLIHIYSDPIKRQEVIAMAAILTPGPASVATQGVLAATWAGAEAENDLRLLEEGKKVAIIKLKANWALDLAGVVEGVGGKSGVEPENKGGIDYQDYLRILLFFQSREMKLLRTMDLIQLNMRANYHKDFLIKDYYGGFAFEAMVQDRRYYFEQKY